MGELIHWGHDDARPTSLHGNGARAIGRTTVNWREVNCRLCQSLRPSETRTRRRIREAIEVRGHHVIRMAWEPWSPGGEKEGICGGWTVLTTAPYLPNTNYGNEVCGLSVEEVLADTDWMIRPTEPCDCYPNDRIRHPLVSIKGDPQHPLHEPGCRWFIDYRLGWWEPPLSRPVAALPERQSPVPNPTASGGMVQPYEGEIR